MHSFTKLELKYDPSFQAHVSKLGRHGIVESVGLGSVSQKRLLRIRCDDGYVENVTLSQVMDIITDEW